MKWASLGNSILPRDKLLSLSRTAVEKSEPHFGSDADTPRPFAKAWMEDDDEFSPVKAQYEIMLKNVGGTHAEQWKKSMEIHNTKK